MRQGIDKASAAAARAWARGGAGLAALLLLAFASVARAEDKHPLVQLSIDPCVEVSAADVRRLAAIELGALLVPESVTAGPDTTRIVVACRGAFTELRVDDPLTGKFLRRDIDVREAAMTTRARLIALAAAELVQASWTELAVNPDPEVPPAGPRPPPQVVQNVRDTVKKSLPSRLNPPQPRRIVGMGSGRRFFARGGTLWGGGLRVADDPFSVFGWSADALVEHGLVGASHGDVSIDTFTVGGAIVAHREWWVISMRAGLGLRAGVARMTGKPYSTEVAQGKSVVAPWGWPLGVLALSITPFRPFVIEVQGEAGYVVLPLGGQAGGVREITIEGAWAGVQFGIGMFL